MSRVLPVVVILTVVVGGLVVAMGRAQEQSPGAAQSVLKRSDNSSDEAESDLSRATSSRRSRSAPIAERLQAIRSEVSESAPRKPSSTPAGSRYAAPYATPVRPPADMPQGSEPMTEPLPLDETNSAAELTDGSLEPGAAAADPEPANGGTLSDATLPSASTFGAGGASGTTSGVTRRIESGTEAGSIALSGLTPTLRVEVIGPDAIDIGKEASYQLTIVNQGAVDARDVEVRVHLPSFVDVLGTTGTSGTVDRAGKNGDLETWSWKISHLPLGTQQRLHLNLVPRVKQPFELAVDWSAQPVAATASIQVRQAQLRIVVDGPSELLYGETASYTIRLSNPGNGDAEDVTVHVASGNGPAQARPIGTLAAGADRQIRFELTAREAGTMPIKAGATAPGGLQTQVVHRVHIRRAELKVAVDGPKYKFAGSASTYKIVVSNSGDATAQNIQAVVQLPAGAKYASGLNGAEATDNQVQWDVSDLPPGAQRTYQLQCDHTLAGENVLQVVMQASGELRVMEQFVTEVEALADLKLVVQDPKGPRAVGEEVVYEVHVINEGTKAAEGVKVVGQFSEGIEPVRAEGQSAELVPGQVLFDQPVRVAPGESLILKITARAQQEGNHKFRAVVQGSDPETKLIAEEMTRFFKPGVLRGSK